MFGFGKLRFRGVDKKIISDQEHIDDYNAAEAIGRVRLGKLCLYYRDLGRKYYVPYDYIQRSFTRISEVQPDDSPAYFYYRLILVHDNAEFANLRNGPNFAERKTKSLPQVSTRPRQTM